MLQVKVANDKVADLEKKDPEDKTKIAEIQAELDEANAKTQEIMERKRFFSIISSQGEVNKLKSIDL